MKKTISLFLALILLIGVFSVIPVSAEDRDDDDDELHIDRAYLSVGQPLSVSCPEGDTLRCFVGDEEVAAEVQSTWV